MKSLLEKYELNLTKRMLVVKQGHPERNLSRRVKAARSVQATTAGNLDQKF